LYRKQNKIQKE